MVGFTLKLSLLSLLSVSLFQPNAKALIRPKLKKTIKYLQRTAKVYKYLWGRNKATD